MPHAFFLSAHLDDVAFSCGGVLAKLLAQGWEATVVTAFTASVEAPTGFALACQTDKGLAADVDYMALRRDEDRAFADALRAGSPEAPGHTPEALRLRHLPLKEAPHRGYESAEALFASVQHRDDVWRKVKTWLVDIEMAAPSFDLLLAPQALGGHVDHVHVAHAARTFSDERRVLPVAWYRDLPYALRDSAGPPSRWISEARPRAVPLGDAALEAKLRGAAAYETQLDFQFGGTGAMRDALATHARAEADRLDAGTGFAEAIHVGPEALTPAVRAALFGDARRRVGHAAS